MSGKNIRRDDWEILKPTIFGWGIKDVNYTVRNIIDVGKVGSKRIRKVIWIYPYYQDWKNMNMLVSLLICKMTLEWQTLCVSVTPQIKIGLINKRGMI